MGLSLPRGLTGASMALALASAPAGAQELSPAPGSGGVEVPVVEPAITVQEAQRPVSPMGAFWRSFLIPGWGQAKLNRKLTGALFIGFEGIAIGMVVKTTHQLRWVERNGNQSGIDSKKAEREDWLTLLVFNHLLSGVEAFVAAHLWDFPDDLQLRAIPGEYGAQITVPVRLP